MKRFLALAVTATAIASATLIAQSQLTSAAGGSSVSMQAPRPPIRIRLAT